MAFKKLGQFLVFDEAPIKSDAVVVLYSSAEWYPRLLEAARLYREHHVKKVVINGNRKTLTLKQIEQKGYVAPCPWYQNAFEILKIYGVPESDIIAVSAENVYDTISEAGAIGEFLKKKNFKDLIITTSKYHTRRASFIWKKQFSDTFIITVVAAREDPFSPDDWWRNGRQIRNVMSEYGAWLFYLWKSISNE